MEIILKIFNLLFTNIIAKPQFFIGLIVFIGYIAIGRKVYDALGGFIKAAIGFMILNVGSSGLVKNFDPILKGLAQKYQISAVVIDSNFGFNAATQALESISVTTSWTMMSLLVGFVWNILLVLLKKFTKVRTVFITGHIMVKQATMVTWIIFAVMPGFRNIYGAILVGLLVGTYWAVFANLTVEATRNLTGNSDFAVGHQQMFGIWVTDKIAHKIGNKEKTVENVKLPGWLAVLNDNIIATGLLMIIFFGAVMLFIGEPLLKELDPKAFDGGITFFTYILEKSLVFSVNIVILMTGVRMFVAELVESFVGISEKLLKGSIPAVDCAVTFGFSSPNAILYGFIFGAVGQLIAILGLIIFKSPIMLIPGFVPLFFDNATLAVYADKKGGIRAATIIPIVSGMIQVFGSLAAVYIFNLTQYGGWTGNLDWDTVWPVVGLFINNLQLTGVILVVILMLIIPQLQYIRNKDSYFIK